MELYGSYFQVQKPALFRMIWKFFFAAIFVTEDVQSENSFHADAATKTILCSSE